MAKFVSLGKQKPNFATGSTIMKVHIEYLETVNEKFLGKVFTLSIVLMATGIDDWDFVIFEHFETHEQLKKKEKRFGKTDLKPEKLLPEK